MADQAHVDSGARCLTCTPACIHCGRCHRWIRPDQVHEPCLLAGRTVYVVRSGDCADRDQVYGVYSTDALAQAKRLAEMDPWDLEHWPGRVQVEPFAIDGESLA